MKRLRSLIQVFGIFTLLFIVLNLGNYLGEFRNSDKSELSIAVRYSYYFSRVIAKSIEILTSEMEIRGLFSIDDLENENVKFFKDITFDKIDDQSKILVSYRDDKIDSHSIYLYYFKSKNPIHKWTIDKETFNNDFQKFTDRTFQSFAASHPLMIADSSLVFNGSDYLGPLYCIDKNSNLKWTSSRAAHHSTNFGPDGTLWFCSNDLDKNKYNLSGEILDDAICQVDEEGNELYFKSLSEIFYNNGLFGLISSTGMMTKAVFHLNDIEVAFTDSKYWKKGDLFLSIRNLNMILLYRPSTDSVIWYTTENLQNQHDVDIVNDSVISVFDNNRIQPKETEDYGSLIENPNSRIVYYDFGTQEFSFPLDSTFKNNEIYTETSGLHDLMYGDMLMVEEQNHGLLHIIDLKDKELLYSFTFETTKDHYPLINWSRIVN